MPGFKLTQLYSLVAYNHHISSIEEQKELLEKYTKRLRVVRELKEQQNIEFQGMSFTVLIHSLNKKPARQTYKYFRSLLSPPEKSRSQTLLFGCREATTGNISAFAVYK